MSTNTPFDPTQPNGATGNGTTFAASAKANDIALWYAVVMGGAQGFTNTPFIGTGTAEQPQRWDMVNGLQVVRCTFTWGTTGGAAGNYTAKHWEVSQDNGTTFADVCTQTFSYDAGGNISGVTNAAGGTDFFAYLIGKVKALLATVVAHVAGIGSAVHGLGSIATQSAASVLLTGGTASLTFFRSKKVSLGSISASTPINWAAGEVFTVTVTGAGAVFTHQGLPNGVLGFIIVEVTNGGLATNLFAGANAPGGVKPSLKTAGKDTIGMYCHDGSTVVITGVSADWKPI